jgi:hypothetical protein
MATETCGTAVAQQGGVETSSRVGDEASLRELEALLAEALDSVLTVSWCEGRLRISVTPAKRPQGNRVVLQALQS